MTIISLAIFNIIMCTNRMDNFHDDEVDFLQSSLGKKSFFGDPQKM